MQIIFRNVASVFFYRNDFEILFCIFLNFISNIRYDANYLLGSFPAVLLFWRLSFCTDIHAQPNCILILELGLSHGYVRMKLLFGTCSEYFSPCNFMGRPKTFFNGLSTYLLVVLNCEL